MLDHRGYNLFTSPWDRYDRHKLRLNRAGVVEQAFRHLLGSPSYSHNGIVCFTSHHYFFQVLIAWRGRSGLSFNTGLLPYGETLQQHRKIFHQVLKADASLSYHEMFSRQASELVIDLLDTVNGVQKPMVAFVPAPMLFECSPR